MRRLLVPLAVLVLLGGASVELRGDEPEPLEKARDAVAVPFLKKHCIECHDEKERSGDVILLGLLDGPVAERGALWRRVAREVRTHEMPPEDRAQPDAPERKAFLAWTARALAAAPLPATDPGRVTVRRLNRAEFGYAVQDLLRVKVPEDDLPADDTGYGFDRIGDVLSLPPLLFERYLAAAERIANAAILDFHPLEARTPATELTATKHAASDRGPFRVLFTNGRLEGKFRVALAGDYIVRTRAYGDQAGPEAARMAFIADRRPLEEVDVAAISSSPAIYETRVHLEPGEHRLAVAFLNDYYKPTDPDPSQRDRNLAVEWLELRGPTERPALPWAHRTYFAEQPGADRRATARRLLAPVVERAWRRPPSDAELDRLVHVVETALAENETWERGLQLALEAALVSPSFLFRLELDAVKEGPLELLDERALATRLAFFLWSSVPDDALRAEAAAGTLRAHLVEQTKRLLADPKASRLTQQFAVQWLQLRRLESFQADPKTFPGWDAALVDAARGETEHLFEAVLRENRSVRDLIDPDFVFVNERLARHYGIPGVAGADFVRARAPATRRGLLGNASVLMATSNPTRTSPVKRGRWVLDVLLDEPPPPPLPGTDSLKDEGTPQAAKSLRARLELHRSKKECAQCHARMDALGFALERFDAVGARRAKDGDEEIDDAGALPDGTKVAGVEGLRGWLARRTPRIARAVAKKLLVFAIGRGPIAADDEALDALVERCAPDYRLQDIIIELVKLDAFQKRREAGKVKVWR